MTVGDITCGVDGLSFLFFFPCVCADIPSQQCLMVWMRPLQTSLACIIEFSALLPDPREHAVAYMSRWVCSACSLALCCLCPRSHYLPSPTLFSVTQKNYTPPLPLPLHWLASAPVHKHIHVYFIFEPQHFTSAISRLHPARGRGVPRAVSPPVPPLSPRFGTRSPLQLYRSVNRR